MLGAEHADREPALTGPYDEHTAFHEPFVLFGYLAGLTRALELIAGVIVLPQRQTALVAKQAAEVAVLSGGRLRLGVGTGWNWVEYDALGVPFRGRAERLEEQVELLRRLWSEPVVTTHTAFHDIERAGILPRPAGPIPIWFGGSAERQLRRAARLGDGFICTRADEKARGLIGQLRTFLVDEGRQADQLRPVRHDRLGARPGGVRAGHHGLARGRRHPPRPAGVRRAGRLAPRGPEARLHDRGPPARRPQDLRRAGRRRVIPRGDAGALSRDRYQIGGWNGRPPLPIPAARCWMIAR